ncbi:MAG TPA: hypothetical protein V6D12_11580 [Candidatus Obscuribacterales bacterium]
MNHKPVMKKYVKESGVREIKARSISINFHIFTPILPLSNLTRMSSARKLTVARYIICGLPHGVGDNLLATTRLGIAYGALEWLFKSAIALTLTAAH